jgi:membrane protein DedA with SNARE-associated domain
MSILSSLLSFVLIYKYYAIFIVTFLGAFALPLPSGSVVMAAAAFSLQGYLNWFLVVLVGIAGNMAGDSSGYWLVRLYGKPVLNKLHLSKFFKEDKLLAVRDQIERHKVLTIYFSRFMTAVAPAVNVVSGFTALPYREFLLFEAAGEFTEVTCFGLIGYLFGSNWEYFSRLSGDFWVFLAAGLICSAMLWQLLLRKKKKK